MPFHADRIDGVLLMLSLVCVCGCPSIGSLTQACTLIEGYPSLGDKFAISVQFFRFWSGFRPPACGTIYYHSVRRCCDSLL